MEKRKEWGMRDVKRFVLLAGLVLGFGAGYVGAAYGQERGDSFPGVRLGLIYETSYQPVLAIKPFTSRFGGGGLESQVQAIIARDLRLSDRFEMLDSLPASLVGEGIDYTLWDQLGATWLVSGQVEGLGEGYVLVLDLHNVVYAELREQGRFPIPDPTAENFRMAVHGVSDRIVEWIFDEPGMAASRIAFSRLMGDGVQELYLVDSDGENMRRITNHGDISKSPTWHPSGKKLAYVRSVDLTPHKIFELDLTTGRERIMDPGREGQQATPSYSPNGRELAFGIMGSSRTGLFSYDVERDCCLTNIQGGRWEDLSPSYSPDGRRIAFNSNRLGTNIPQVYVVSAQGGQADLISPYVPGTPGYYTSPDWSPIGDWVAFHGRIQRNGRYQILVAEVQGRRATVLKLTAEGNNEDPSWAPDGRHLVFSGERSYGFGLFVVDASTGRIRPLVSNIRPNAPEWSPSLAEPVEGTLRAGGF
jgi:TolB protein